jgi:hypothetical protein
MLTRKNAEQSNAPRWPYSPQDTLYALYQFLRRKLGDEFVEPILSAQTPILRVYDPPPQPPPPSSSSPAAFATGASGASSSSSSSSSAGGAASVPPVGDLEVDIGFGMDNTNRILDSTNFKTKFMSTVRALDPRVAPLVSIVKQWSKARDIGDAKTGTLNRCFFRSFVRSCVRSSVCLLCRSLISVQRDAFRCG